MISPRNSRSLLYTNQSSVAGGFHELFWRWSSLEKTSKKYHTRPFQRNAVSRCIHLHSRRNSSLSHPSSIPNNNIESTATSIDSSSKVSNEPPKLKLLSHEVRKVMRHVPHAVVVLTTPYLHPDNLIHDPSRKTFHAAGMTLSSFTTLTLSPDPIITFNIKRPSRTLDALKATQHPDTIALVPSERERRFHIHILQCNPAGAKIANHFSRGGPISPDDVALLSTRPEKFTQSGRLAQGIRRLRCEKVVLLLQPRQLLSEIRESVSDAATIGVDPRVQMPQREEAAVVDEDLRPVVLCGVRTTVACAQQGEKLGVREDRSWRHPAVGGGAKGGIFAGKAKKEEQRKRNRKKSYLIGNVGGFS
ncbi:hypothetical protein EYC84_007819 [Monilinia fructicola]|uniref:Flavin reductase like domain-containing protein n=1 Tax=Monilinia fructicola TaxID=38448 RepID=A0A5M9JLH2_MONFR|nr:hypothetical protein EYC84_007819 [Monilinia fructicola]